jgi:two-component system, cell cycle response regulator
VRILIAEDDAITRRLLQAHLKKWGHDVVVAADGAQAWRILNEDDAPNLVILDWMMPEMDGVTVCQELRKLEKHPYVYVILLTARTRKEDVIEGLEAGADDYMIKPFDTHELKVRVRAGCRIIQLQQDLMAALETTQFQALHDPLTGLLNRRAILDILPDELARAKRNGGSLGVVIADLDYFKRINDTFGHLAGDAVLREVSKRMMSSKRQYDSIGRYGGEEFIVVLPGSDKESARSVAERLRCLLDNVPIVTQEGVFEVTMSLGVASVDGSKDHNPDSVIQAADAALYKAKRDGRNRVELWRDADPHPES